MRKYSLPALAVALVCLAGFGANAAEHSHTQAVDQAELTLNHGKKWPTDGTLRRGMSEIRRLVAGVLPDAHAGRLDAATSAGVGNGILDQVNYLTANCKLPEQVDAQLHLVLARIVDGADQMKAGKTPAEGVAQVVGAINAYGQYFDHPGWRPLEH